MDSHVESSIPSNGKRKAEKDLEMSSKRPPVPHQPLRISPPRNYHCPSTSATDMDLYNDLNLSGNSGIDTGEYALPDSFGDVLEDLFDQTANAGRSVELEELSNGHQAHQSTTLLEQEIASPFVYTGFDEVSNDGEGSSRRSISASLLRLENEPAVAEEGVPLDPAVVYHDSMYSSGGEISDEEETYQDQSEQISQDVEEESQDVDSDGDLEDFDNDHVDALLEGGDGYGQRSDRDNAERAPLMLSVEKHLLIEKARHHFEFLPMGWLKVNHQSGMPVYFHRETRICTFGRPYGLGKASLRGHKVPVSAIPCLEYRRALDEEERVANQLPGPETSGCPHAGEASLVDDTHSATVHTADDHVQKSLLSAVDLRNYCAAKLFQFRSKTVRRYSNWKVGRGQLKIAKKAKAGQKDAAETVAAASAASSSAVDADLEDGECNNNNNPVTMVKSAKIITITRPSPDGKSQVTFNLNPANKTPVSVLSEYIQHARRLQPSYEFLELPDSNTPYQAVLIVGGKEEGRGVGASKKVAKAEAAKSAIMKLAPELKSIFEAQEAGNKDDDIFDDIVIEDHRVAEIAHKSSHPAPYQLLVSAMCRQGAPSTQQRPNFESKKKAHLKNVYTMTAGVHRVSFTHQLHQFAKQMCSQLILKEMHPELKYYGDLLKLYGRKVDREKVKKKEDQRSITDLQTKGKWGEPNWELLEKLKDVMRTVTPMPLKPGETSRIRY
ncbi:putative Microprocessor complex subunit DGCR8 [Hypsibius exemplaris]|uniref:Microprocessor complex subunit DGCR8 n=1 Tax=Hypsibius exemplaris TaxID=2072580 RepID=A0A1W0WD68_HYPEX|nr:putative Microprocessor complex subunit DGCR8 [Hypsibius exemplaris]